MDKKYVYQKKKKMKFSYRKATFLRKEVNLAHFRKKLWIPVDAALGRTS